VLSVAVYNTTSGLACRGDGNGENRSAAATRLHKSNILLIGPRLRQDLLDPDLAELLDVAV